MTSMTITPKASSTGQAPPIARPRGDDKAMLRAAGLTAAQQSERGDYGAT